MGKSGLKWAGLLAVWEAKRRLDGESGLGLVNAQTTGVKEVEIFPIIEYWKAGDYRSNPLCEVEAPGSPPVDSAAPGMVGYAQGYGYRESLGLKRLSADLLSEFDSDISRMSVKDMNYQAQNRRKNSDWSSLVSVGIKGSIARQRALSTAYGGGNGIGGGLGGGLGGTTAEGFHENFCTAFSSDNLEPSDYCFAMGNFTQRASCVTAYDYESPDAVLAELSPANGLGYTEPAERCFATSAGFNGLDLSLRRFDFTPKTIDVQTGLSEEKTYYALHKAIDKLQRYAEFKLLAAKDEILSSNVGRSSDAVQAARASVSRSSNTPIHELFTDREIFTEILPGWKVERVFNLNEPRFMDGPTLRTPYAVLASKGKNLLVVLRRPITTYETRLALSNQQSLKYLYNFHGEAHDGASTIYITLSGVLELAIKKFYEALIRDSDSGALNKLGEVKITLTGAYLPSSGATVMLASHIENFLTAKYSSFLSPNVAAVVFGNGLVSDQVFVNRVADRVEVRNVIVTGDSADLTTCPQVYSCDERVLLPRTGIKTGILYRYTQLPGRYQIPLTDLARYHPVWQEPSTILQLAAIKDCAYSCYLAAKHCPTDSDAQKCDPQTCQSFV